MSDWGIMIADTDIKKDVIYDSRKKKVTVDLDPAFKRADVITLDGGTILDTTTPNQSITETLVTIPHNMPFKPQVHGFFYVTDAPDAASKPNVLVVGTYSKTVLDIIDNSVGYGTEAVYMIVTDTNVEIHHDVNSSTGISGANPFHGIGSQAKLRFRYIVTNQRYIGA